MGDERGGRGRAPRTMWGGRFRAELAEVVRDFNASVSFDRRLALHDIAGSIAHAAMLGDRGLIAADEAEAIIDGLQAIRGDIEAGSFDWRSDREDVHMNIEAALIERIGPVGGKLHTARSRNDQVATDLRLWLRDECEVVIEQLAALRQTLVDIAEAELGTVMPGYTHLQVAQPVLLSHHLMAYYEMFTRDSDRLADGRRRLNVSPLGAGALAGTTLAIDMAQTARQLGFDRPARNSMDAVSDRDFVVEFAAAASLAMMHLSRLGEELTLWASHEFGFIRLPDSHATGSSIMPQKKNPDIAELVRGKTGRVYGNLVGLLTTLKGLPLTYNKDLQEDKEGLFDTVDTLKACLLVMADMLPSVEFDRGRMREAAVQAYSNATDLADYLVGNGMPFREAHEVVGKLVALAIERGIPLEELEVGEMRKVSGAIDDDVYASLDLDGIVNRRVSFGGTATSQVRERIAEARESLDQQASRLLAAQTGKASGEGDA